jgi:hypothetical protein
MRTPLALGLALLLAPAPARAFALLADVGDGVAERLAAAPRWSAEPDAARGFAGGISVAVDPALPAALDVTEPANLDLLRDAIDRAFRAWENGALHFEIEHDSPVAARGTDVGAEIDLFAVPGSDPVWFDASLYGVTDVGYDLVGDRLLSNGTRASGYVIRGADIFLNIDNLKAARDAFGVPVSIQALALTRLVMHEVGHALGLGHPNQGLPNYDTDLDPLDEAVIDPRDPFADLIVSPAFDSFAIMAQNPCGEVTVACSALFYQQLRPDDRLGRDVLYPFVPEPGAGALGVAAAGALAARATRRRRARPPGRGRAWVPAQ